jgi:hypothetical protein
MVQRRTRGIATAVSKNIFAISSRVNQAFAQSFGDALGNEVPLKRFAMTAVGAQVSVPVAGSCRKRKHLDKQLIAPRAAVLVFLHELNSTISSRRTRSGRAAPARLPTVVPSRVQIGTLEVYHPPWSRYALRRHTRYQRSNFRPPTYSPPRRRRPGDGAVQQGRALGGVKAQGGAFRTSVSNRSTTTVAQDEAAASRRIESQDCP